MGKIMATPELSMDLPAVIQRLRRELAGSDIEKVKSAQEVYRERLDGFYEEHQEMIAPWQYEGAKTDADYFIALIQLVRYYQQQGTVDREEKQPPIYVNWKLFTQI
jgi:hypothetical protein